ncbi:MAG TPA: hypothetical protein VGD78_21785 [Chthoniobacterales bacterium]
MKLSLRVRLLVMALMGVAPAATIVGAAAVTWRQVNGLRRRFSGVQIEAFRTADHLQASVLNLNVTLLRFVLGRNPGDWQAFARDADQLKAWLGRQRASTARERQAARCATKPIGVEARRLAFCYRSPPLWTS